MRPLSNYDACDPFETMADVRRRAAMAKKKPAKKARKAREWTVRWLPMLRVWLIDMPEFVFGKEPVIRVREILPRKRRSKR